MTINIETLKTALQTGEVHLTFEKVDGSTRTMRATLKPELLPPVIPAKPGKTREPNPDVFVVYSVDDKGWRSFRRELFISAEIL